MMVIPSPRTLRAAVLAACCIILPCAGFAPALAATTGVGGQAAGGQAIAGQAVSDHTAPLAVATQAVRQRTKNAPADPPAAVAQPRQPPARAPFTAADEASAAIP